MTVHFGGPRRRFRFVRLEERIAPSSFGSGYHHHSGSGYGNSDPYTPVVTTVTVSTTPGEQTSTTFVGGVMTGTTTTSNPGGISSPITSIFPAGTPYTYNGAGFTISYYQAPQPPVSPLGS